jgi:hypothetical protein
MNDWQLVRWLDIYITGLHENGQDVPQQLLSIRRRMLYLANYNGGC